MASESESDEQPDGRANLAERVVATSGSASAETVLARLLGGNLGPDAVSESFREHDVTLSAEDFLAYDEETRHELRFDGRVEHLPCVADALIAAVLVDHDPVTVRSLDPVSGDPVTVEVTDDDATVSPRDAVVSIGLGGDVPDDEDMTSLTVTACGGGTLPGGRDPEKFPDLVCAYVNAFESRDHYERWTERVDAESVAVPATALLPGIRRFAEGPVFD